MSLFSRWHRQPGPPPTSATVVAVPAQGPAERCLLLENERMPSRVPSLHFTVRIGASWDTATAHWSATTRRPSSVTNCVSTPLGFSSATPFSTSRPRRTP